MEYFDVVDKNRNKTGKVLPRDSVRNKNEYNVGVEVWIINSKNELLLTKRCLLKSHPLQWETQGGCLLSGESSIDGAIRELKEETGITVFSKDLKFLYTSLYKYQFVDIYLLKLDVSINDLHLQKEEVSDAKWVTFSKFINLNSNNKIVPSVYSRYELIKDMF